MRIRILAAAVAIFGIALASCGGEEDPGESTSGGTNGSTASEGVEGSAADLPDDRPALLVEPFFEGEYPHEGHHPVFTGRDLRGWTTKMGRDDSPAIWVAAEGTLVGRLSDMGEGGVIRTAQAYSSYVAQVDFRVDGDVLAGVLPRMHPNSAQVELLLGGEDGGLMKIDGDASIPFQAGGAYLPGEWNHLEFRARGSRMLLEVWLNGAFQGRLQIPPHSDREDEPWSNRGSLATSVRPRNEDSPDFEGRASFRNIVVRYLPEYDPRHFEMDANGFLSVTEAGATAGWSSLFDHQTLEGWEGTGGAADARVEAGLLRLPTAGAPGVLQTTSVHRDFHLLVEYRMGPLVNSGVFLRHDPGANVADVGRLEVSLLDDLAIEKKTGRPTELKSRHASLEGIQNAVIQGLSHPAGTWNTVLIGCDDDEVVATLNHQMHFQAILKKLPNVSPPFEDRPREGRIAFEFEPNTNQEGDTYLDLRNVFVRTLGN